MHDNTVRQSQLITLWGPGAMIDLPECSVIVAGLQDWSPVRRERVNEPRLAAKLRRILDAPALDLFTPPRHEEKPQRAAPVGARIFPTWFIVEDARPAARNAQWRRRRLVRWDQLHKRQFVEDGRRKPVVPVRFVAACPQGHIDDLNWRAFVHPGGRPCERPLWLRLGGHPGRTGRNRTALRGPPAPRSARQPPVLERPGLRRARPGHAVRRPAPARRRLPRLPADRRDELRATQRLPRPGARRADRQHGGRRVLRRRRPRSVSATRTAPDPADRG